MANSPMFTMFGDANGKATARAIAALDKSKPPKKLARAARSTRQKGEKVNAPSVSFHIDPRQQDISKRKINTILLYAENIGKLGTPELNAMGNRLIRMIRMRTKHGLDVTGQPFAPLSTTGAPIVKAGEGPQLAKKRKNASDRTRLESYSDIKKRRISKGVNSIPAGSSPPPRANLYATGRLFKSLNFRTSGKNSSGKTSAGVSVTALGTRNRKVAAFLTEGTKHAPARPFIGLTRGEEQVLTNTFLREVKTGLDKQILRARNLR